MSSEAKKTSLVLAVLTIAFFALAIGFSVGPASLPAKPVIPTPPVPKPTTVRISAGQLMHGGGDTSGLDCYTCHDQSKPPVIKFDSENRPILPKEHADLILSMKNCDTCHLTKQVKLEYTADGDVIAPQAHKEWLTMSHGQYNRNDNCYNCHNPQQLDQLVTRDGTKLKFDQATLLCASCHGPTYRDWKAGVHGRTNGYWNQKLGSAVRQECPSCHDPHAPKFPQMIPLPAPHRLHPEATATSAKEAPL